MRQERSTEKGLVRQYQGGTDTTRADILQRDDCPASILDRAPKLGPVALNRLAAAHPNTSVEAQLACAQPSQHWSVRHAVLSRPDLPAAVATDVIATWRDRFTKLKPNSPKYWTDDIGYPASDRACLAANPAAPPEALEALASSLLPMVLVEVARNPSTPADVLSALLNADDEFVAAAAASNPSIDGQVLQAWVTAGDREAWAIYRAATNPACPADTSDELLAWMALGGYSGNATFDPDADIGSPNSTGVDLGWNNSKADERGLWAYSAMPRIRAQQWTADRPLNVPQSTAAALAEDRDQRVRAAVLRLQPLAMSTVEVLKVDPVPAIARAAERYVATPKNLVENPVHRRPVIPWRWRLLIVGCASVVLFARTTISNNKSEQTVDELAARAAAMFQAPSTESATPPTPEDRIQIWPATELGADGDASSLYQLGKTALTPKGSGLETAVLWLRDAEKLQVMFSVMSASGRIVDDTTSGTGSPAALSGTAGSPQALIRTAVVTWTQPGFPVQTKLLTLAAGQESILWVLIEPGTEGTVTLRSTDGLAPIKISCNLEYDCVAQ